MPEVGADVVDQRQHVLSLRRIESVGRLVEQQQLGVVDDGLGQLDPLALAGAHGADRTEPLLAQPTSHRASLARDGGLPAGQAVQLGEMANHVVGGYVGRQGVVFGRIAEAGPDLGAGDPGVPPEHGDRPAVGAVQARGSGPAGWSCPPRWRRAGR